MKFKRYFKKENGFTLIELILASSISLSTIMIGFYVLRNIIEGNKIDEIQFGLNSQVNDALDFIIDEVESGERIIDETDSLPLIKEDALMIGQKESNQVGPTLSDLGHMMFTENYAIMQKVQLDGGTGISSGDDLLLETGEHMILESPSEGIKISDISSIYPSKFVTNIERDLGHKTNLTHSAVIQTG